MKRIDRTNQSGYALILMVLGLMGIGGIVLSGFTQSASEQTEQQRYLHNERVLKEAKRALLQYAYNYPQMGNGAEPQGPGRLLCPDTDDPGSLNSGLPNANINCTNVVPMVGRFPWRDPDLNFYDVRDASGEPLWFAVSSNFAYGAGTPILNSDTTGTITIQDRSGAVLFDGSANNGVAAVIIAPGPPIERGGVEQDRADDPGDPVNYLDLFGAIDNADFVNNDLNGFVKGPIFNPVDGSLAVNDQIIVITTAEVIAMAEMATLQAYRDAILDYLDTAGSCTLVGDDRAACDLAGGDWSAVYPWLYNYEGVGYTVGLGETVDDAIDRLSTFYPADADFGVVPNYHDDNGRIPTIFGRYFNRSDSEQINNQVEITLINDYAAMPGTVSSSASGNQSFFNGALVDSEHELVLVSDYLPVEFSTDADAPGARLSVTLPAADTITQMLYFWDDDEGAPSGFWRICPDDGNGVSELSDCHRDSGRNPDPGGDNKSKEEILRVKIEIVMGDDPVDVGEVAFDADYENNSTVAVTASTSSAHALISANDLGFDRLDLAPGLAPTITATYDISRHYHDGGSEVFVPEESGTLDVAEFFAGAKLKVEMRYFPEIPRWARTNRWHNSIRMAYAEDHRPEVPGDCTADVDCLKVNDDVGGPEDQISLLLIGGGHGWDDNDEVLPGDDSFEDGWLDDELRDVFDEGNHNGNTTYYTRRGNDRVLVIEEL